jgi:gluconolactonase
MRAGPEAEKPMLPTTQLEVFASGLDHSEGICVTPDGTVYVGGEAGQLYRIEGDDSFTELLSTGGFLLGLASDAEGRIYACDPGHRRVWRIDPASGEQVAFCSGVDGGPLVNPNWGCFDAKGNFYFSDSGAWKHRDGKVVVVRPGGEPEIWTEESRDFPNGMAVSPDGSALYVLESTPGALVRYAIGEDGGAGPRELVIELPGAVPDGVAVAADGSLVIACYRPDVIYRWRADLGLQLLAADPEGTTIAAPTNVAFAGPDLDYMIVPNIGRWHLTRFRHPELRGVPLFFPTRELLEG